MTDWVEDGDLSADDTMRRFRALGPRPTIGPPVPGDLVPAPEIGPTAVKVVAPAACPNGHTTLRPHWRPCNCGGHYLWTCRQCDAEILAPPAHDP